MPRTIELIDKKVETLFSRQDFEYLLDKYMGYESVQYFRELIAEIEDSYNEQIEDITDSRDGKIDELTMEFENLREKLEKLKEVLDE